MDIEDKMGGLIADSQEDYKILTLSMNQVFTVDELKHYAEDEGKSTADIEAITQPEEEMKFMADGVVVIERKK